MRYHRPGAGAFADCCACRSPKGPCIDHEVDDDHPRRPCRPVRYHRVCPTVADWLRALHAWVTGPTDHHTVVGRCVCPVCTTHLWEDR